jgi:hypothetical protein
VSYALRTAGDARADLRVLEPWIGEELLDELEKLLLNPSTIRVYPDGTAVHEFERFRSKIRHVVFLDLRVDHRTRLITLAGVHDQRMPEL